MFRIFPKSISNPIPTGVFLCLLLAPVMGMNSTIEVTPSAHYSGAFGLQVQLDGASPAFVGDETPSAETRYRCRFYLRLDDLEMAETDAFDLFTGVDGSGETQFRISVVKRNGLHELNMEVQVNQGDTMFTPETGGVVVPDGYHAVEMDWVSGPGTGYFVIWLNGVKSWQVTDLDNDAAAVETVFLGAVANLDLSTRGRFQIDAFQSQRQCYVGRWDCDSGCQYASDRTLWPQVPITELAYLLNDPCFSFQ